MSSNVFNLDMFKDTLKTRQFGQRAIHLQSTGSTNSEAKRLLDEGAEEGTVVVADIQTAGRGRLMRFWDSPEGGLWFSIILKPLTLNYNKLPILSLMAGCAVAESINEQFSRDIKLKWPNDIILDGKKLGGILTESIFSGEKLEGVIVGIGINLNFSIDKLNEELTKTATTLQDAVESIDLISRENLLSGILTKLEMNYDLILRSDEDAVLDKWRQLSTTINSRVLIKIEGDKELKGKAVGLDSNGALIIETEQGKQINILAGDCFHLNENEKN